MKYIYNLLNIKNQKSYIGKSFTPYERQKDHFNGNGSRLVYEDVLIFGPEAFELIILEEVEDDDVANQREEYWIAKLNTNAKFGGWGYNYTDGGDGLKGRSHPFYGIDSEKHPRYGVPHTTEARNSMSEKRSGNNNPWYGKGPTSGSFSVDKPHPQRGKPISDKLRQAVIESNKRRAKVK